MNTLRNSVKLIGRLGQDPEVKTLERGSKIATFHLATRDSFTAPNGNREDRIQWHTVVAWGSLAGLCEKYLKKGREIAVDGRLTYHSWQDRSGTRRTAAEIVANELLFVSTGLPADD
jgi:single-strand DNA-binding protein